MRLGGEMHYGIGPVLLEYRRHGGEIADIDVFEVVIGAACNVFQALEVGCIGQLVEIDDRVTAWRSPCGSRRNR